MEPMRKFLQSFLQFYYEFPLEKSTHGSNILYRLLYIIKIVSEVVSKDFPCWNIKFSQYQGNKNFSPNGDKWICVLCWCALTTGKIHNTTGK